MSDSNKIMEDAIRTARIIQDKLTRHACAEAVLLQLGHDESCADVINKCHAAVMNCSAGLKGVKP